LEVQFCRKKKVVNNWGRGNYKQITASGHLGGVSCLEFQEGVLVSGSADKNLIVWNVKNGKKLYSLKGHTGGITCLRLHASTGTVVSGSMDKTLRLWDLKKKILRHRISRSR